MKCIRCGRESENEQTFCNECLKDMERHPVEPGVPIQLPNHNERPRGRRSVFKLAASKWEAQISLLKHQLLRLLVIIVVLLGVLAFCICMLAGLTPDWLNGFFGVAT